MDQSKVNKDQEGANVHNSADMDQQNEAPIVVVSFKTVVYFINISKGV